MVCQIVEAFNIQVSCKCVLSVCVAFKCFKVPKNQQQIEGVNE